ncbi:MAG: UvrD-helicase domain-containing protein [Candidatus Hydrogenedens sp.]|jgi:DNA helicase-2/ATP-dependent DNA helicase PcrA|nr:UvrD-helicase domain-containing protein [Candidatus Hydrogenedens sp.]
MSVFSKSLLASLNPPQHEAVTTVDGPVLVLAGAGSGKTRVITTRIAYLIKALGQPPESILAVTFTNKAAEEMRIRVSELVGDARAKKVTISTFHSFCLQVLRRDIGHLGRRRNFTIYGENDARILLRRVTDELGVEGGQRFSPARFHQAISLRKNSAGKAVPVKGAVKASAAEEKYQSHLGEVYGKYQSALHAANSLDFDDLLLFTHELWQKHPEVLERVQQIYRYVMVDEYQDTNRLQYDLLHMLTTGHRNLCVVGDDDQSIYSWRGAAPRNILDFEKDYPEARIIALEQNYRSTGSILAAANEVIKNNLERRSKVLWTAQDQGRRCDLFIVGDEEDEARQAVKWLEHIVRRTKATWRDFAILYRSNIQSRPFELALRHEGIPYKVVGGQDFFERAEIKDILSYLKLMANPRDEAAFLRIVNMPRRGIGDALLHQAHDLCREEGCTLSKALFLLYERGRTPTRSEGGIIRFLRLLQEFRKRYKENGRALRETTEALIRAIDYRGEVERVSKTPEQAQARLQNLDVVLQALSRYTEEAEWPTLSGFLDETHLNNDSLEEKKDFDDDNRVHLMTIHSAKGLEFPFVFITGMEDGMLPHEQSMKEGGVEEERRLFYVALTRGRRHVSLFQALSRARHGKERDCKPSRFLTEIPPELMRIHSCAAPQLMSRE